MVVIRELPISDVDANRETTLDARFTSFLERDNSFLTPWSWDPKTSKNETSSTKEKEYLYFHPESYFSYEINDPKGSNIDEVNYNPFSSSASELPINNVDNKETMLDARLASFLEKDNSFLTPWNWDPKSSKDDNSFHPGSYFSYEITDRMDSNNDQVNYNQVLSYARSNSQVWYPVPLVIFDPVPTNFMFPIVMDTTGPICMTNAIATNPRSIIWV